MSWKNEFNEKFVRRFTLSEDRENTNIPNCAYSNLLGVSIDASDIKDFIEELIKETREDEHKKTWDNIKEIYDTTDYKKHIEEAIKETEQRVAREFADWLISDKCWITDKDGNVLKDAVIDGTLEQFVEKYKGVE
jgi:thiamine pyrophosphate-dependent acetolactate synthase large subunit-like protein